jgi:hypothetical protein
MLQSKTTFTVNMAVSLGAAGLTITISPGIQINSGDIQVGNFTVSPTEGAQVTISGASFAIEYTVTTTEKAGSFTPSVEATSGSATVRPNGMDWKASTNSVMVN